MSRPGSETGHAPLGLPVTPATANVLDDDCRDDRASPAHLVQPRPELEHERPPMDRNNSPLNALDNAIPAALPAPWTTPKPIPLPDAALRRATTAPPTEQLRPSRAFSLTHASAEPFRSQAPQLSERDSIFATHYLPSDNNDAIASSPPSSLPGPKHHHLGHGPSLGPPKSGGAPALDSSNPREPPPVDGGSLSRTSDATSPPRKFMSRPAVFRRASDLVLQAPPVSLTGSHVGWVKQQETVESSKVAGSHRIAIRETFHPLRKIVSEGPGAENHLPPDLGLAQTPSDPRPHSHDPPMLHTSYKDHDIALADTWHAARHLRNGDRSIDVTWDDDLGRNSSRGRSARVEESIEANLTNAEPTSNVRSRKSSHYLGLFKENTSPDRKRREARDRAPEYTQVIEESNDEADDDDEIRGEGHDAPSTPRASHAVLHRQLEDSERTTSLANETAPPSEQMEQRLLNVDVELSPHSIRTIPRSLSEEIRNFHLTSGGIRGSSFSPSIPTLYAEKLRNKAREKGRPPSFVDGHTPPSRKIRTSDVAPEEEEDEHISSALYFPHEVAPSEEEESFSTYRHEEEEEEEAYDRLGPAGRDQAEAEHGGHVDISLLSQKDNTSILHGDYEPHSDAEDKSLATISEYSHETTSESDAESALSTLDELSSLTDDAEHLAMTPTQDQRAARHRRKHTKTGPIGAVELKPYRHQVGGHTTVFRFSRRAVCKQLNNRENEFYERIERRHPEMLVFLPRLVLFHI
jgi:inositol-hexakisphosphate 5-kinase